MWPLSAWTVFDPLEAVATSRSENNWKVFESYDEQIHVNATVPQKEALTWLCSWRNCSRNDVLLAMTFRHLYGTVALEELWAYAAEREARRRTIDRNPFLHQNAIGSAKELGEVRFSRPRRTDADIDAHHIGEVDSKSPVTFRLPASMLLDLQKVAAAHGIPLATYFRKLLVVELDGERRHTPWQKAKGKIG